MVAESDLILEAIQISYNQYPSPMAFYVQQDLHTRPPSFNQTESVTDTVVKGVRDIFELLFIFGVSVFFE